MRRTPLVLVIASLAVLAVARADDAEPTLPFNPFTDAKEGDWETLFFQMELPGRPRYTDIETWRVTKVTDDTVSIDIETLVPGRSEKPAVVKRTFARQGKLTLRDYFSMAADDKLT